MRDLPGVALVFMAAFPESIAHYIGHAIPPTVLVDLFSVCLAAESNAFFVAQVDERIAGYIFAPAHFSRIMPTALRWGTVMRMAGGWLSGQYGFGLRPALVGARNWFAVLHEAHDKEFFSDARILSIAVHPDFQGQKIGDGLMRQGLSYLAACGVTSIRLEVRPENAAAVHLYQKYGFIARGSTRDTQGAWLIMLKESPHA
jgi:ribosomal protein S18 acetylase RimI-like enzyme